jgi:hypothetical protein
VALHFTIGWWAGLLTFFPFVAVYDRLFIPRSSLCLGMPLMLAMASFMALAVLDLFELIRWLFVRS